MECEKGTTRGVSYYDSLKASDSANAQEDGVPDAYASMYRKLNKRLKLRDVLFAFAAASAAVSVLCLIVLCCHKKSVSNSVAQSVK